MLKLYFHQATPVDACLGPLATILAFFFAMRSCEYLTITGERRTKLLRVQDLRFFQDRTDITHDNTTNHLADIICIMFRDQKNGEKDKAMHHPQSAKVPSFHAFLKYIQPSLLVQNHHVNISKDH